MLCYAYLTSSFRLGEKGANYHYKANVGNSIKNIEDSHMDEAVALSKGRLISDYQKLDYEHHYN